MDAGYSRTGVFYQAMPAVGADGKNIMKLIPVQMVNGQFVQTMMSRPSIVNVTTPPVYAAMPKQAVLNPSVAQHTTRKHFSQLIVPQNQTTLGLNKLPQQQQTVSSASKVPQMGAHSAVCGNSLRPNQLSVTVKSPNLPKGQCLQIPPTAQVRTVPASELPLAIKKQIFTSSSSSSVGLDTSSVVYVSPVTTVSQDFTPPNELTSPKPLYNTTKRTTCRTPETVTKPHLKLIPKLSQRPNSPIRWVIEEAEDSAAPHLKPVDLSETFRIQEKKGSTGDHCDVTQPESQSRQGDSVKSQENALVMCNGKVFLLAKKSSLPVETTAVTQRSLSNQTALSSPQRSITITDEVIDLCDDDSQDDSPQQVVPITTSALSHQDEDNVIFVSYIPPKSSSTQAPVHKPSVAAVMEADQAGSSSCISMPAENGTNYETGVIDVTHSTSEQNTSTSKLLNMEVEEEAADPQEIESSTHVIESSTNPATVLTPPVAPQQQQIADHMLRQIFGITSDVKIFLQRIDEVSVLTFPLHTESMEGDVDPASGSKTKLEEGHSPQESHTSLKKSHFTKPSSALLQKCLLDPFIETPCDRETEQVIGYVAPIDEDFPSTDENNITVTGDAVGCPQTCTNLTTIIRRVGRMRKRTMCPCCIPATLDPALKSSARLEETEKWALISEDTTKKGGKTKTSRKDGRTGRVSCAGAKNKQNFKSHMVCESVDSEEIKKNEQKTQRSPEEKQATT